MSFADGEVDFPFSVAPADTYTYWYHAVNTPLIFVPYNLIGPVSLIKIFGADFDLMFLLCVLLFCALLRKLYRYMGEKTFVFAVLLLANPLVFVQFFAPNKEILVIISMLAIIVYLYSKEIKYFLLALIVAMFSKPQYLALILFFEFARRVHPRRRNVLLFALIVFISIFYSNLPNMQSYSEGLLSGQTSESLGVTMFLEKMASQYYLYAGVVIPRLLVNVYAGGTFALFFFLPVVMGLGIKRKLRIADDEVLLLVLFGLMLTVLPFPHHRYLLPAYPLLLHLVLRPRHNSADDLNVMAGHHESLPCS